MNHLEHIKQKICTSASAREVLGDWPSHEKVVFTNGCFDLIHTGHITYLSQAADLGTRLVVGLNSDASVKRLKGEARPVKDEVNRALVMASFEFVDLVVIFDEDTPLDLIKQVQPDVLVKGGDYDPASEDPQDPKYIVGSDVVRSSGGRVETIAFVDGYSTTNLISRSKS